MPRVQFTANLQRHVPCPPCHVAGRTLREALEAALNANPALRGYVLDEHGELRHHMIVFLDGRPAADPRGLGDPVVATSEICVMQALSGG